MSWSGNLQFILVIWCFDKIFMQPYEKMQNGAMKSAAIALSACSPARAGESWTKRFPATPDSQVCRWPNTTQDAISEVQLYSPCFSSNMSSDKDRINFAGRPAAPVENSSHSPIPSSDVQCPARSFSKNRETAHTVWNDTVRSSAGLGNGAVYMQRSRNSAGTEISDLKESLLTSSNEMFSQSEPTVNEDFSFPWRNSMEVLRNLENSVGFDKQNLYIQQEMPASLSMDRLTTDGKLVNGIDVAWSTILPYCSTVPLNINAGNGFRALREETTDNARRAEPASLLNASNDKVLLQVYSADSYSNDVLGRLLDQTSKTTSTPISDSFGKGNSPRLIKMDDISSSNNVISSTISHITPSMPVTFQSSNTLNLHTNIDKMDLLYSVRNKAATVQRQNSAGTVNDFASASSSSYHRLKSTSHTDENEEPATEQIKRTCSVLENGDRPAILTSHAFKKPRITPGASTLSASLKVQVRKVKLGERITALQQLVSPFGKTDTASVLLEAIGYIKFLQEQVQVLSAPYLKAINPCTQVREGREETKYDLRSRGLCLVPLSSTAHVTNDNGADFWSSGIGSGTRF